MNVRSGHGSKGHQLKDGKVFAVGGYVSRFSFKNNLEEFRNNVYCCLRELLERLHARKQKGEKEEQAAAEIHRNDVMAYFYRHATGGERAERYNSHTACFCCLFELPEHALPCGHILCTSCVKAYGYQVPGSTVVEMSDCPIEGSTVRRYQSWKIHLKPNTAGIRILCLDGYSDCYPNKTT